MSQSQHHSRNLRPRRVTIPDSIKSTQHDVAIYSNEHISRLPPEILVKILINFDITSLIGFRRVSKQFEAAIEAIEASNETIKIGEKWLIMAGTKKLFKKSPAVVIRNVLTKTVDGQIVPRYPDAKKLMVDFDATKVSNKSMKNISELVRFGIPKLSQLAMDIDEKQSPHFFSKLKLEQITELECFHITSEALNKCTALQNFRVLSYYEFDDFFSMLEITLKNKVPISYTFGMHCHSSVWTKIIELICGEFRPHVKQLPGVFMRGAGLEHFEALAVAVPNLESLSLTDLHVDQFTVDILNVFPKLQNLITLGTYDELSGEEIVQRLMAVAHLKSLDMNIFDREQGSVDITEAMSDRFPELETLEIFAVATPKANLNNLNCPELKSLKLKYQMTEADLLEFIARHPRLEEVELNAILVSSVQFQDIKAWTAHFETLTRGVNVSVEDLLEDQ